MKNKNLKVILYPAITLDGFIADPNGECYSWINDEDEAGYTQAIAKAGCVLLGRKTYEQYPNDFPPESGAAAFIWTTREDLQDKERVKFVRGTAQNVLQQIAEAGFSEVIVGGGGEVNGSLAEAGLADEIIVSIYNVTIGEGIPLFGSHKPKMKLELLETTNEIDGIVKNHYKVI
ncbi:MAG TPA: dihydrofolate reductase family protein [Candidatus Saccharimonadales bacterium]|nr:dihydrofolate reductase family protein [Candidatus Saccharimonadales bacterium]